MRLGSLGPVELILIVVAIVLIFGASKIGDIGGALGKSIKEFRKASKDEDQEAAAQQQASTEAAEPAQQTVVAVTSAAPQQAPAPPVGDFRPPDATPN
ncbi:MAG: twin-arginine translocase TatA/TatE family subunit [Dehalococcoidia bacterium]